MGALARIHTVLLLAAAAPAAGWAQPRADASPPPCAVVSERADLLTCVDAIYERVADAVYAGRPTRPADSGMPAEIDALRSRIADTAASAGRAAVSWTRLAGNLERLRLFAALPVDPARPGFVWDSLHVAVDPRVVLPPVRLADRFVDRSDIAAVATRNLAQGLDDIIAAYADHLRLGIGIAIRRDSTAQRAEFGRLYDEYLAIKMDLARRDTSLTRYFVDHWEAWFLLEEEVRPSCCKSRWARIRGWTAAAGGLAALITLGVVVRHHRARRAQGAIGVTVTLPN